MTDCETAPVKQPSRKSKKPVRRIVEACSTCSLEKCAVCEVDLYILPTGVTDRCHATHDRTRRRGETCSGCGQHVCADGGNCDCSCDLDDAADSSDTESDTEAVEKRKISSAWASSTAGKLLNVATKAALEASLVVAISNSPLKLAAAKAKEKAAPPPPLRKEKTVECLACAVERCSACETWIYVSENGNESGCDLHGEMQEGVHCPHCDRSTCANETCGCACDGCRCDLFTCAHCMSMCYQPDDSGACDNPNHTYKKLVRVPVLCDTCDAVCCRTCKVLCRKSVPPPPPEVAKAPVKASATEAAAATESLDGLKKRVEDRKRKIADMQKKSAAETMARVTEERKSKKAKLESSSSKAVAAASGNGAGKTAPKPAKADTTMDTKHSGAPTATPLTPPPPPLPRAAGLSQADEDELLSRFDARQAYERRRALLKRYFSRQKEKEALKECKDVVPNSDTDFAAEPCFCKEVTCYVCKKEDRLAVATEVVCKSHSSTTRVPDRALMCTRCARYCCAWECADHHAQVCKVTDHLYS